MNYPNIFVYSNEPIPMTSHVRDLGDTLDNKSAFSVNMEQVISKLYTSLGFVITNNENKNKNQRLISSQ